MRQAGWVHTCSLERGRNTPERFPAIVVKHKLRPGSAGQTRRNEDPEILQEANDVSAPAGSDGGGAKSVFEDQIPSNNPRKDFSERRVAIGVGRAGHRNHCRKLGVTQSRKHTTDTS